MSTRNRTTNRTTNPQPTVSAAEDAPTIPIPPAALARLRRHWLVAQEARARFDEIAAAVAETIPLPPGRVQIDIEAGVAFALAEEEHAENG